MRESIIELIEECHPDGLTFHSDIIHGWIEVKREVLEILGIADKISSHSSQEGDRVFLESDVDSKIFLSALRQFEINEEDYLIRRKEYENTATIRFYDNYCNFN
jgi:hypothetical protein